MKAVIPYKKSSAKSRLSPVLTREEREEFVELMLNQVIDTLKEAGVGTIEILSPSMYGLENMTKANVLLDKNDLNEALNGYLEQAEEPVIIVMADLPLLSPDHAAQFHRKSIFLGAMHFQDLYNLDLERVEHCGIHYATPDGRIIPFCTYNNFHREGVEARYSKQYRKDMEFEKKPLDVQEREAA